MASASINFWNYDNRLSNALVSYTLIKLMNWLFSILSPCFWMLSFPEHLCCFYIYVIWIFLSCFISFFFLEMMDHWLQHRRARTFWSHTLVCVIGVGIVRRMHVGSLLTSYKALILSWGCSFLPAQSTFLHFCFAPFWLSGEMYVS